ncbi:MAG: glycosyltransferase [Kangiellaceae bacterium]|nr:glycosyltransferase [Kangiellaceae bacterium]
MVIKILHVVLSLGTGGLENGIVNTINGCDREKFKIDVICLRELGELGERIQNPSSEVLFDSKKSNGLMNAVSAIREANNKNNYNFIHTHGWATMLAGFIAKLLDRSPIIINGEHGTLYFNTFRQRIMQRFLFNRMKINLSVSGALVKEISRRFRVSEKRFIAILNGVDTSRFQPNISNRQRIRSELALDEDILLVGSVGRLVNVKNYPSLIRAYALIHQQYSKSKLLLVGDGPEREALVKLTEQLDLVNNVIFLGRREDIPAVMNALDIFVLPSFREGLSNTILEAMSSGLPAVVSKVGGSPEIVIEGETGHLFEVDDIAYLSSLVLNLFNKPKQLNDMSRRAREHVTKHYSLLSMVEKYQNVYEDLNIIHKGKS